ncbi:replication initiation protein [Methylovulum psychrotolerans]|nr:replication initiation protein [Methylovulum psychrotolerans]
MAEKNVAVRHNPLTESRYKLSAIEQRLVGRLVAMVEPDDGDFKQYPVPVADFTDSMGHDGGVDSATINKAIDGLMDAQIKLEDGDNKVQARWLSSSRYQPEKGLVLLRFDPELKPWLLELKGQLPFPIIQLKHIYSIRLYRLLKPYEPLGKRSFSVLDLREALQVAEGVHRQHRDFRRWVIKVAQAELREKADIRFEFAEQGRGKALGCIKFTITPNGEMSATAAGGVSETVVTPQQNQASENPTVRRLVDRGVADAEAVRLAENFDGVRIDQAIAYVEAKQEIMKEKVKNPAILIVVAIEKDLANL